MREAKWFNASVSEPLATSAFSSPSNVPIRASSTRMLLLLWATLPAVACSPAPAPPRALHHRLTRPANPDGVFLNEELVFYFSDDVDRASVTRDSVRIVATDGSQAHGALAVDGASVRFTPDPVLAPDLSDGGYRPDTQYTVEIRGFPSPDGLRGAHGEPLETTYRWAFRTVRLTVPRSALVFDDRMQDARPVLLPHPPPKGAIDAVFITPRGPIDVSCKKPLDPSSLRDEDFELRARSGPSFQVRARLVENRSDPAALERLTAERRAALIELTPKEQLPIGNYVLRIRASRDGEVAGPVDFSGRPALMDPIKVRVTDVLPDTGRGELHEEFLDTRLRSPVAVPGYDGTAHWSDTGRVEVRYPAAAGDGSAGEVQLTGDEPRTDIQATRVDVREGTSVALSSEAGLVVVRCQGRMSIAGELKRAAPAASRLGFEGGETLSDWLSLVRSENRTWTVLIAGGDLVIEGAVRVSTPLLLCAGGVIRVSGTVSAATGQLYLLGEGGGLSIDPSERAKAPLAIDAPLANPLRAPLRLAVLSGPIPPHGDVLHWLAEEARGSEPARSGRCGRWSVRYVPELPATAISDERLVPVDSPRLFEQPGSIQLLITLEIDSAAGLDPRPAWDPPFVDYVRLLWEQPGAEQSVR